MQKDMFKHMKKKNACHKNLTSYEYSDDQLLVLSLLPYYNETNIVNKEDIEYLKDSNIITDNIKELLEYIENIQKDKSKKCKYCNENFDKIIYLKKHVVLNCYYKELQKKNNSETSNIDNSAKIHIEDSYNNNGTINNNSNNTTNNTTNNNTTNINNNITNIIVEIKNPVPFDEDWDISKIHSDTKMAVVFNNLMYTTFLEEILKNDTNLNVIIDKKSKSGMVYKNDIDKYIKMKLNDINDRTMEKLKNQLLNINEEIKPKIFDDTHVFNRRMITKKYIDYCKNEDLQQQVSICLSNVYDKKTKEAVEISKSITDKPLEKLGGY
jgi:hypothetical protein